MATMASTTTKLTRRRRLRSRVKLGVQLTLCTGLLLVLALNVLYTTTSTTPAAPRGGRALTLTYEEREWWSEAQLRDGYIAFHVVGVAYMFIFLAIVCDDYFVPSLDVMVERFDISPDVAGATLMAAGGSAPELFTSLIGTFSGSDVGFGTIVGSAVFNVLFVIGCCALFSKETLTLTWWPLARDCSYYSISLLTVALFFGVITPGEIELWEAATLFSMYLGYCTLMKFNQGLRACLSSSEEEGHHHASSDHVRLVEEGAASAADVGHGGVGEGEDDLPAPSLNPFLYAYKVRPTIKDAILDPELVTLSFDKFVMAELKRGVRKTFKRIDVDGNGFVDANEVRHLLEELGHSECSDPMVSALLARLDMNDDGVVSYKEFEMWYVAREGKVETSITKVFNSIDTNGDGKLSVQGAKAVLQRLNPLAFDLSATSDAQLEQAIEGLVARKQQHLQDSTRKRAGGGRGTAAGGRGGGGGGGSPARGEAAKTPSRASPTVAPSSRGSPSGGKSKSSRGTPSSSHRAAAATTPSSRSSRPSPPPSPPWEGGGSVSTSEAITKEDFTRWYSDTTYWEETMKLADREVDEDEGLELCPPYGSSVFGSLKFYLLLPILICLKLTLPDVRQAGRDGWYPVTFLGAVCWIGVASFLMVWFATTIGDVYGVPPAVMGLTVLAAGTSVPDLLTSVIVARQGEGDMAVSSSIGSNIFDVLVGLPLPWIMYSLTYGRSVLVGAESLFGSILILFVMLSCVIGTVACFNWRMTRSLGAIMFVLYFAFVAQDLARVYGLLVIPGL